MTGPSPGIVESLHIHPPTGGGPMAGVDEVRLEADKGIMEDRRYFNRGSRRQVTLMEREQINAHAEALGLSGINPGVVRSNIETSGINLVALVGREVAVGTALLQFYEPRQPCEKMDAICLGLRELMAGSKQGVLAKVTRSGVVRVGDCVQPA